MYKFLFFDEQDPAAPVEVPEETPEVETDDNSSSGTDYSQLLYEYIIARDNQEEGSTDYSQLLYQYISSQDVLSGTRQEEMYAAYTQKLDSIDTELKQLNKNLEWIVALLVFVIVLYLYRTVRGWVTMLTGGMKDVH